MPATPALGVGGNSTTGYFWLPVLPKKNPGELTLEVQFSREYGRGVVASTYVHTLAHTSAHRCTYTENEVDRYSVLISS